MFEGIYDLTLTSALWASSVWTYGRLLASAASINGVQPDLKTSRVRQYGAAVHRMPCRRIANGSAIGCGNRLGDSGACGAQWAEW